MNYIKNILNNPNNPISVRRNKKRNNPFRPINPLMKPRLVLARIQKTTVSVLNRYIHPLNDVGNCNPSLSYKEAATESPVNVEFTSDRVQSFLSNKDNDHYTDVDSVSSYSDFHDNLDRTDMSDAKTDTTLHLDVDSNKVKTAFVSTEAIVDERALGVFNMITDSKTDTNMHLDVVVNGVKTASTSTEAIVDDRASELYSTFWSKCDDEYKVHGSSEVLGGLSDDSEMLVKNQDNDHYTDVDSVSSYSDFHDNLDRTDMSDAKTDTTLHLDVDSNKVKTAFVSTEAIVDERALGVFNMITDSKTDTNMHLDVVVNGVKTASTSTEAIVDDRASELYSTFWSKCDDEYKVHGSSEVLGGLSDDAQLLLTIQDNNHNTDVDFLHDTNQSKSNTTTSIENSASSSKTMILEDHFRRTTPIRSEKVKEKRQSIYIMKHLRNTKKEPFDFDDESKWYIRMPHLIDGEINICIGRILRPIYSNPLSININDIEWKVHVSNKYISPRQFIISSLLLQKLLLSTQDTIGFIILDMFVEDKSETKAFNKEDNKIISSLPDKEANEATKKSRTVRGSSTLFYIHKEHIYKIIVKDERMTKNKFKTKYPNASHAFAENWNLHKVHRDNGKGHLLIIKTLDNAYHLCITLMRNEKRGIYMKWLGDTNIFKKRYVQAVDTNGIFKYFETVQYDNNQIKGYFVNQVFGEFIQLIKGPNFNNNNSSVFTTSPHGPDILRTPKPYQLSFTHQDLSSQVYNVIYVYPKHASLLTKTHNDDKKHVSLCLNDHTPTLHGHTIATFANIETTKITQCQSYLSEDEFHNFIHNNKTGPLFRRLVPSTTLSTRVKLIDEREFLDMTKSNSNILHLNDWSYIFATESNSLDNPNSVGVLLSSIGNDESKLQEEKNGINYDTIQTIHSVYGKGTNRSRCGHLGLATYRGTKNSNRSHPLPVQDDNEIHNHQYFMQTQNKNALEQPYCEKLINALGQKAEDFGRQEHPQLYNIVRDSCNKSILTSGSPSTYRKHNDENISDKLFNNKRSNWLGFSCSNHVDTCDRLNHGIQTEMFENECVTPYMKRFFSRIGPGMPTSCQYYHIWNDEVIEPDTYTISAYLLYNGLGMAITLKDFTSVTFVGYAFSHCTTFCYLFDKENNMYVMRNDPDIFCLMAWGRSGGAKEFNRNRMNHM